MTTKRDADRQKLTFRELIKHGAEHEEGLHIQLVLELRFVEGTVVAVPERCPLITVATAAPSEDGRSIAQAQLVGERLVRHKVVTVLLFVAGDIGIHAHGPWLDDIALGIHVEVVRMVRPVVGPVPLHAEHDVRVWVRGADGVEDGGAVRGAELVLVDAEAPQLDHGTALVVEVGRRAHERRDVVAVVVQQCCDRAVEICGRDAGEIVLDSESTAVLLGRGADLLQELEEGLVVVLAVEALDEDAVDAVLLHPAEMGVNDAGTVGFEEGGVGAGREDEIRGEEAFLWILLHGREHVELDSKDG